MSTPARLALVFVVLAALLVLALRFGGGGAPDAAREGLEPDVRGDAPTAAAGDLAHQGSAPIGARGASSVATRTDVSDAATAGKLVVSGLVLDLTGAPFPGADVHLREVEDPAFFVADYVPADRVTRVAADGTFSLRVPHQGEYVLWAGARDHGASALARVMVNPRSPRAEVELRLTEHRELLGRVVDDQGKPVGGADVRAFVDLERAGLELPWGMTAAERFGELSAKSDGRGEFRLAPLYSEGVVFVLRATRRMTQRPQPGDPDTYGFGSYLWSAEVPNVPAGPRLVTLALAPARAGGATLAVHLVKAPNSVLPGRLFWTLRALDPSGGVYYETRDVMPQPDTFVIEDLVVGRRYELVVEESSGSFVAAPEPFVAVAGENRVDVELPLTYLASFHLADPGQRTTRTFDFTVLRFDERGRQRTLTTTTLLGATSRFQLRLPAGEYHARVTTREPDLRVQPVRLLDLPITMPAGDATFELEIPAAEGAGR